MTPRRPTSNCNVIDKIVHHLGACPCPRTRFSLHTERTLHEAASSPLKNRCIPPESHNQRQGRSKGVRSLGQPGNRDFLIIE
jgi:hypothetical protein